MRKLRKKSLNGLLAVTLALGTFSLQLAVKPVHAETANDTVKLRIMETTDIHTNIMNYDYYQDKDTNEFGYAKTATLIKKARGEVKNSMLFDNGDLIQGNPLADYVAKINVLKDGETHPVYKAMNLMDYDAGNIGNHEFNYGLDFLQRSIKGANFPYVNANIYIDDKDNNPDNDQNYFTPYRILDKKVVDDNGQGQTIKVGVIGFVPPQIMQWDKGNLEGKVITKDIVETAKKFIPQMKAEGADLIVAIPHSGFGSMQPEDMEENAVYHLSSVPGIDAILFGHSHVVFPGPTFKDGNGVDNTKGTINGVAAVEPGFWGDHLGVVDMTIQKVDGKWKVTDSQSVARPIYDKATKTSLADVDQEIVDAVKTDHEGTLEYVRGTVAETTAPIYSYFALVQDDPSIQIVTNAQKWYVEKNIQGTELEGIPVLSAGAPFKAGGRSGASYYTDIAKGTIAIKNVSDLYIYPNTLKAVKLNGDQVKEWLEMSAGQFNQIDPSKSEEQQLVNDAFPTYNFDVIDGVTYQIDVTKPAKYDTKGKLVNPEGNRIKKLEYNGKPVTKDQQFIVVTNNYRASGGGNFPGLTGKNIVIDSPDENRQVVINYLSEMKTVNPSADKNWSIAPINKKVNVVFNSSPNAKTFADQSENIKYVGDSQNGFAKYQLNVKPNAHFDDVLPDHWAYNAVEALAVKKVINGVDAFNYEPARQITRAEFAALLVRALGLTIKGEIHFTDVASDSWYADEISIALHANLVKGQSETIFAPNALISRQEMAAMLVRAYEIKTGKNATGPYDAEYTDLGNATWGKADIITASALGFMKGYEDGSFGPLKNANRAESAQVVYNLLTK